MDVCAQWDAAVITSCVDDAVRARYAAIKDLGLSMKHIVEKTQQVYALLNGFDFEHMRRVVTTEPLWAGPPYRVNVRGDKDNWVAAVEYDNADIAARVDGAHNITQHGSGWDIRILQDALTDMVTEKCQPLVANMSAWIVATRSDNVFDALHTLREVARTNIPHQLLALSFTDPWMRPFIEVGVLDGMRDGEV